MQYLKVTASAPGMRLLGRLDPEQDPVALDWTGSGLEIRFRGSDLWAELEAPAQDPVMWMIVLADGCPVTRFPVEAGCRFYPLLRGMDPAYERTVSLLKETQPMPSDPGATVLLHGIRLCGELTELPAYDRCIEFIGDSLTSAEGALAPRGNEEWITPWFTCRGNYSWYACAALNAERRILSQSGYGVCWSWEHNAECNMYNGYEKTVGVLSGPEAEKRGCQKPYDFSARPADIVCIRLLTNDLVGIGQKNSLEADRGTVVAGCVAMIRKVRACNPGAKIVWILPGSDFMPELAEEAVSRARAEGIGGLYSFAVPDYTDEEKGARDHPDAGYNKKIGLMLGDYLKTLL